MALTLVFTLLLATLKVWNQIDAPWVWVFSPIWLPFSLIGILTYIDYVLDVVKKNQEEKEKND